MKKTVISLTLLLMVSLPAGAQHYIGARAGWGVGFGRFAPAGRYNMDPVWGMWSGGLQWKYYGQVRYIGAIGAEIEFIQRAYQTRPTQESEDYTRRVINSFNVPLIWHIHFNIPEDKVRIFLNAGVWASYNMSNSTVWEKRGDQITERPYDYKLVKDNPVGFGLLGGLGVNYIFGKWEIALEARYYFAYGDILRNMTVYPGNPFRSPLDNVNISLGFFYRLGDKPHKPLPPPWYLKKQVAKQQELMAIIKEAENALAEEGQYEELTDMQRLDDEYTIVSEGDEMININENNNIIEDSGYGNDEAEQSSQADTEGYQ